MPLKTEIDIEEAVKNITKQYRMQHGRQPQTATTKPIQKNLR